jgi:Ca2+-binding EF-hand superfamily protein
MPWKPPGHRDFKTPRGAGGKSVMRIPGRPSPRGLSQMSAENEARLPASTSMPVLRGHTKTDAPEPLTKEELQGAKDMFDKYDRDGSGEISYSELTTLLHELRISLSDKVLDKYIHLSFADLKQYEEFGVGLTFKDFSTLYKNVLQSQAGIVRRSLVSTDYSRNVRAKLADIHASNDEMYELFKRFDANSDNQLDLQEIKSLLIHLGFSTPPGVTIEALAEREFAKADKDFDGLVSYQEFVDYINGIVESLSIVRQFGTMLHTRASKDKAKPKAKA